MSQYFSFQWHITDECDQRCKHCYIFSGEGCKELKSMTWKQMTEVVANCEDFCKVYGRVPYFYITGGDPILHPDFWKLMVLLKSKKIPFTLMGNPFHLNDEICRMLKVCGCEKYQMSLDGMRETHDWFRKPGSFDLTIEKIGCLNRAGIKSVIMSTVSVPKEEQFIVEGRHEGIITKEDFLKAQEIFCEIGEMKNVIPKTYPLYRKVKCGICGRAMSYKTYSRNGVSYRYFTCPHAKEQTGEDGCCKRYVIEDNLNEIVWSVIRQLLAMTDAFKQKLDKQNNVSRQDNLILAEKLARLQQEKEKCESDRFVNVDQFMVGQLDKEMYQRRRADLGRLAEKLDADIAELEQKLKAAETMKDDSLSQALGVMKKYSGADELTQAMVQELIEKVVVMDLEHVEIVWKFKDEVRNFIGI